MREGQPRLSSTALAYSARSIALDYVRGGMALALLTFVFAITEAIGLRLILVVTATGCVWFLARTRRRQIERVRVDTRGVRIEPGGMQVDWDTLQRLRLRWFGSPRTGKGWLELELQGSGRSIKLDSELQGFDMLLEQATAAAHRNGLELDSVTAANLAAAPSAALRSRGDSSAPRG